MDILAALDAIEDEGGWDDTVPNEGFVDVPPDKYQVRIEKAFVNSAKSSGRTQISWHMRIMNGPYANRMVFKHDGIDEQQSREFTRGGIERLGQAWPSAPLRETIPVMCQELEGTFAEVEVVQKPDKKNPGQTRTNTYFLRALDDSEIEDETPEAEANVPGPTQAPARGRPAASPAQPAPARSQTPSRNQATSTRQTSRSNPAPAAEEPEEPEGELPDDDGLGEVAITFDATAIDRAKKKRIVDMAAAEGYKIEQYPNIPDALLCDLAEHLGISGDYDDPETLIGECEAKLAQ